MKTIFKQKLLVLFAALLALCLLAAGIGMLAAPHTAKAAGTQENTEVNALEQNSGYLWFKLTVQDYSIGSYQGDGDTEAFCTRLNELNTLSMIEFDGAAMNTLPLRFRISENPATATRAQMNRPATLMNFLNDSIVFMCFG